MSKRSIAAALVAAATITAAPTATAAPADVMARIESGVTRAQSYTSLSSSLLSSLFPHSRTNQSNTCLLYTSDAADE